MLNVFDRLRNRKASEDQTVEDTSFAANTNQAVPNPINHAEPVLKLGQDNEAFRQMFLDVQRRIDDVEKLRIALEQMADPFERNLLAVERERVENATLRATVSEARGKIDTLHHELMRAQRSVETLEAEKSALLRDMKQAKETLSNLESTKAELTHETTQARSQIMELERSVVRLTETSKSLEVDKQSQQEMIAQRDAQISQLEASVARLSESVVLLEGENASLSQTLAARVDDYNKASRRLAEAEHELESAKSRLSHTKQLLSEAKNERKTLADQLDEANSRAHAEKSALSMKVDAVQARATLAEKLLGEARNALIARTEELRQAERKIIDANVSAGGSEQKVAQMKSTIETLERQIREIETSRTALVERANTLAKNLKARDASLAKLDDRIPVLMSRIEQLEGQLESGRSSYQARIDELSVALETERMARTMAEGALETARKERAVPRRAMGQPQDSYQNEAPMPKATDLFSSQQPIESSETVLDLSSKLASKPRSSKKTPQ